MTISCDKFAQCNVCYSLQSLIDVVVTRSPVIHARCSLQGLFGYMIAISFLLPVSNCVRSLVVEKELKIKEGMKMMSLTSTAHTLSWVVHWGILFWTISLLILLFAKQLFLFSDPVLVFLYFFLFLNATMAFCFFMSTLFSRR